MRIKNLIKNDFFGERKEKMAICRGKEGRMATCRGKEERMASCREEEWKILEKF